MVESFPKRQQRLWEDNILENVVVAGEKLRAEFFQQSLQFKPVGREESFLKTFLMNDVEQFLVPTFSCSFWQSSSEGSQ